MMHQYINKILDGLDNWADYPANYFERQNYVIGDFACLMVGIIKYKKEDDYKLISFTDLIFSIAIKPNFMLEVYHISVTLIPAKIIETNDSGEFICQWLDIKEHKEIIYYDKYSILKANEDYSLAYWEQDEKRSLPLTKLGNNIFDNIKSTDAKFYNLEFALSIIFGSAHLYEFFINALMNSFSLFKLSTEELVQVETKLKTILKKVSQFQKRKLN